MPSPSLRRRALLVLLALGLTLACRSVGPSPGELREGSSASADGLGIHFVEGGHGAVTLVFVHGWLGDAAEWEPTMRHFAGTHRVVALDLAGHGRSQGGRDDWTVEAFGADVAAVVRGLDLERVVLVGHSMSATVAVEAARVLGERVALVVPVDSLNDVDWDLPPEVWDQFFGGLRADFPSALDAFFRGMLFVPGSPADVVEAVLATARGADPAAAVSMLERARAYDLHGALRALVPPIHAIVSDANPVNLERNRQLHAAWDFEVVPGVGHWSMLEAPETFREALEGVLRRHGL